VNDQHKKIIRIHYAAFRPDFYKEKDSFFIHRILQKKYAIVEDRENPEFLICGNYGDAHSAYHCVKIFYTGENITPDFNIYDYAIGFDEIVFADRYIRVPLYRQIDIHPHSISKSQKKFCNFLYSNSQLADPVRVNFFKLLSEYKRVDSGGAVLNNIGECVGERDQDRIAWQKEYKFSIAFENSSKPGYTTEKILFALQAHTIPIYWGNPEIAKDFNAQRFINCHDFSSFKEVVEKIKEIDNDDGKYEAMLSHPWFPEGRQPPPLAEDPEVILFLTNIVEQGPKKARRTVKYGRTAVYTRR